MTGWADVPGGQRAEIDEHHQQRAWREREIAEALNEAELAPLDVIEFDPYGEAEALAGEARDHIPINRHLHAERNGVVLIHA